MDKEDIQIFEWERFLHGDTPPVFIIEIIIRALALYTLLMLALRMMGKRMALRMTRNELAAVATLSAAIGMPMQTPDRGLLPAALIVVLVITLQRLMAKRATKDVNFEQRFIGRLSTVISNGVLDRKELKKAKISRDRIFSQLRTSGVRHLGEVERLYLEATGSFTLILREEKQPGLSVLPEWDKAFIHEHKEVEDKPVCTYCGKPAGPEFTSCPSCGNDATTISII